jgi:hypothetical protein
MKKITLTLSFILGVALFASAQGTATVIPEDGAKFRMPSQELDNNSARFERRQSQSGWYVFAENYGQFNGLNYNGFITFLFPDSAKIIFPAGEMGVANTHVFGSMFDPKDPVFGSDRFSRWTDYTYDSMSWAQCYIRQVDSMDESTLIPATGVITVSDFSALAGATFEINGTTLTEGLEWDALTDNNTTANLLAAAIRTVKNNGADIFTVTVDNNIINITSIVKGEAGNLITISSSDPVNLEVSGSTLTGGETQTVTVEIIDTLFIQYFTAANQALSLRGLNFAADPNETFFAGLPRIETYQPNNNLLNSAAFRTDTLLLTADNKDSVTPAYSFISRRYTAGVNASVQGRNELFLNTIAASITFKPMKKYTIRDTLIALLDGVNVANKHNLMGVSYVSQSGYVHRISNEEAINNLFVTNGTLRTGNVGTGGWRSYSPFLGGISTFYFHISTDNLSVTAPDMKGNGIGEAYPNPTYGASNFTVPFSIATSGNVQFVLTDITGKTVQQINNRFDAGDNTVSFNSQNLTPGVYFYQMIAGSYKGVGKIIVK